MGGHEEFLVDDLAREEETLRAALAMVRSRLARAKRRAASLPPPPPPPVKKLAPCGTYAAYMRHYRKGEEPDGACREAFNRYRMAKYRPTPVQVRPCGTEAAYYRHRRRGEPSDALCDDAARVASARRHKVRKDARKVPPNTSGSFLPAPQPDRGTLSTPENPSRLRPAQQVATTTTRRNR